MIKVTPHEFQRNLDLYQNLALNEPVVISNNGENNLVLISAQEYKRLRKRDRTVLGVTSLSEADINTLKITNMSDKHNHFNIEIDEL